MKFILIKEAFHFPHNPTNFDAVLHKTEFFMQKPKEDYSFWTKYRRFASTEILLYVIMIVGIVAGLLIFG